MRSPSARSCAANLVTKILRRQLGNGYQCTSADYNFDHPDAFDVAEILRCLDALKRGAAVDIPVYDFNSHARKAEPQRVAPAEVILFEGILVLHIGAVLERLNMKARFRLLLRSIASAVLQHVAFQLGAAFLRLACQPCC